MRTLNVLIKEIEDRQKAEQAQLNKITYDGKRRGMGKNQPGSSGEMQLYMMDGREVEDSRFKDIGESVADYIIEIKKEMREMDRAQFRKEQRRAAALEAMYR